MKDKTMSKKKELNENPNKKPMENIKSSSYFNMLKLATMAKLHDDEDANSEADKRFWNGLVSHYTKRREGINNHIENNPHSKRYFEPLSENERKTISEICEEIFFPEAPDVFGDVDLGEFNFTGIDAGQFALSDYYFPGKVILSGAKFSTETFFARCTFSNGLECKSTKIDRPIFFTDCTFSRLANFDSSEFLDTIWFTDVKMEDQAPLQMPNCVFRGKTRFKNSIICNELNLNHTQFHSETSFIGSDFKKTPMSTFSATFFGDTDFSKTKWPPTPILSEHRQRHLRLYGNLKVQMSDLNRFDYEHMFQRFIMRCRSNKEMGQVEYISNIIYRHCSDYGWSLVRPIFSLLLLFFLSSILLGLQNCPQVEISEFGHFLSSSCYSEIQSLSFSNMFPYISNAKKIIAENAGVENLWSRLTLISILQTVLAQTFVFFFVVALRNRYKVY